MLVGLENPGFAGWVCLLTLRGLPLAAVAQRLYHQARKLLRPLHPNRVRHRIVHAAHRLGWHRLRSDVLRPIVGLHPARLALTSRWLREFFAERRRRRQEPRLTVAVDVSALWEPLTGIGWYLFRLLEHCAERDDVRLRLYGPELVESPEAPRPVVELPNGPALELVTYRVPEKLSLNYIRVVAWLRRRKARLIAEDHNDVLFAPNYFLPPWFDRCQGQRVATVHDLGFQRVPWTLREETRRDLLEHLEKATREAAWIVTDSETVLGELLESGMADPERISAVHLGPGPISATDGRVPAETPETYVLHIGTLEPRKNLTTLLAAWRILRQRGTEPPPLVFGGRLGWKTDELRREMEVGERQGWLHHFGYLEDEQVAALYRGAHVVALPSIYEGFGLPAVEAMHAGVPLVASDIPVLREVGGSAALYVPPEDPEAWADAFEQVLGDDARRADLAERGRQRSRQFDWAKTAQGTIEVWKKAKRP